MATKHRRITISLPPHVDEALLALAKAEGRPQAKVVIDVLIEFAPTMLSLAKLHEQVKSGQQEDIKRSIQHMLGDQMANLLMDQMQHERDKR